MKQIDFIEHGWFEEGLANYKKCFLCKKFDTRRFTHIILGGQESIKIHMCNVCQPSAELLFRLEFIPKRYHTYLKSDPSFYN